MAFQMDKTMRILIGKDANNLSRFKEADMWITIGKQKFRVVIKNTIAGLDFEVFDENGKSGVEIDEKDAMELFFVFRAASFAFRSAGEGKDQIDSVLDVKDEILKRRK